MKDGYIKVAAATPKVKVADTVYNGQLIKALMKECTDNGAKVVVFPELCITGYTCQDLFLQEILLREAKDALLEISNQTKGIDALIFLGIPLEYHGKLYNTAAILNHGKILGIVPKRYIPNYNEFYEVRHFTRGMEEPVPVHLAQAKCYAYIYGFQNRKEEMGVLMTYISSEDGTLPSSCLINIETALPLYFPLP